MTFNATPPTTLKHKLRMHIPRPDGVKQVFCEMSLARKQPCNDYVTFNAEGELKVGHVIYRGTSPHPRFFCSWGCIERYARGVKRGTTATTLE